jgi:2,4-dienoyl-CoA reductase-like NADH-dependent reductase (Old Yellow Enzyme family)
MAHSGQEAVIPTELGSDAGAGRKRTRYVPTYHPDGRKVYNPSRTMLDIYDEWDAITDRLIAEGDPRDPAFVEMRAKEIWRQEEENGERWKEWQVRVWHPRCAAASKAAFDANERERALNLNKEEIERLIEHFAGANDPVAQSILAKAMAALS